MRATYPVDRSEQSTYELFQVSMMFTGATIHFIHSRLGAFELFVILSASSVMTFY
jgi:hypothetical protein